jgi:hypothetical protein
MWEGSQVNEGRLQHATSGQTLRAAPSFEPRTPLVGPLSPALLRRAISATPTPSRAQVLCPTYIYSRFDQHSVVMVWSF